MGSLIAVIVAQRAEISELRTHLAPSTEIVSDAPPAAPAHCDLLPPREGLDFTTTHWEGAR